MINKTPGLSFTHGERTYKLDQITLAPDVEYECPVCKVFMTEPQRICSGINPDTGDSWSHRLCWPCLEQLAESTCPLCRREIKKTAATTDFATIANLRVHCPNQDCATTLPVSPTMAEAHQHLAKECAKEIIECPGKCGIPGMKRETLGAHEQLCPRRYICECKQIFSGATSQEEIRHHVNENPEQHPHAWLLNYFALPTKHPSDTGVMQPAIVARRPEQRTWAGVNCHLIAKDVYQAVDNKQVYFVTVPHCDNGSQIKCLPYRDEEGGPLNQLELWFLTSHLRAAQFQLQVCVKKINTSSSLASVDITTYKGEAEQFHDLNTILEGDFLDNRAYFYLYRIPDDLQTNASGHYLFKVEI